MIEQSQDQVLIKIKNDLPHVYEQIKDIKVCAEEIRITQAKNIDLPIVERFKEGRWNSLYSKYNPVDEAEKWANSIEGTPKHIILFGFGLGYHYEALKKKFPKVIFHVIEPDPQMFLLYSSIVEGSLKNKVSNIEHFLLSQDKNKFYLFFEKMIEMIDESWLVLSVPKYQRNYEDSYKNNVDAFKKAKDEFRKKMFSFHWFEKMWNVNVLKNLPYIYQTPSIFEYQHIFEGRSVIVTASGPSLNEAIPFLQRMKDSKKAIIVAAGTSMNALLNKGIEPDLFVSYDPLESNYLVLKDSLNSNVPFVFGSTIQTLIPATYQGPMAHMTISQDTIRRYLDPSLRRDQIVDDAPTITAVTMDMLYKLKVKDVYLVGQDLCFFGDRYQAEAVYPENKDGRLHEVHLAGRQFVENNAGQRAETNRSFMLMKEFIEEKVKDFKEIDIYTLSLYGAKINGIGYCSYEVATQKLDQNPTDTDTIDFLQKTGDYEKLDSGVLLIKEQIDIYKHVCETLHRQYDRFNKASDKQKEKWRNKIDQTLSRLTNDSAYAYLLYPFIVNRVNYMLRLRNNSDFTSIEAVKQYYQKGLQPFLDELEVTLRMYKEVLGDLS
jgi:hypothetical protein